VGLKYVSRFDLGGKIKERGREKGRKDDVKEYGKIEENVN
jgi:hypothetical protein